MKNALVFLLVIFLGLTGCDTESDSGNGGNNEKEIDSRLAGSKFSQYRGSYYGSQNYPYFKFTKTTYTVASSGPLSEITIDAYTSNGNVLSVAGDTVVLSYAFIDPSEFEAELKAAIASGNQQTILYAHEKVSKAETGLFVRFTVLGSSSVDFFNWEYYDEFIYTP